MFTRGKLSRLQISGVPIPPRSDTDVSVSIQPIQAASSLRRALNGDLLDTSMPSMRRYRVSISGSDMIPPGIMGRWPGDYVEIVTPDYVTVPGPSFDRMSIDAHAISEDTFGGRFPDYSTATLQTVYSSARISALRAPGATHIAGAAVIRCRPILACRIVSWSQDQDERTAKASWSIELEEA